MVSDSQHAAQLLKTKYQCRDIHICDKNTIHLYNTDIPVAAINRTFFENGLDITEAHICEDTLEDYFKKVTGGEGLRLWDSVFIAMCNRSNCCNPVLYGA